MLDEPVLPLRSLDSILLGLTFSVTGAPRHLPEPAIRDLLTTAPPAGGTGGGVGRLAQAPVLCPGTGTGWAPARPGLSGQGSVPAWPLLGPWGPVPGYTSSPPQATSPSLGCHLSGGGGVSLGRFSPIPLPGFGGFLLGKGLEGHQPDGERSPRGRRGSSRQYGEPLPAGECQGP